MVIKKCIVVSKEQDQHIQALVVARMARTKKMISYSSVLREVIDEGLKTIR